MARRPAVFIASSTKHREDAQAIRRSLEEECDCVVWNEDVATVGGVIVDDLIAYAQASDFAVFIFAADDQVIKRGEPAYVTRDNVVFELGLFMGLIGPDRCFLVVAEDRRVEPPTDIEGRTFVGYDSSRREDLRSALGTASDRILNAIREQQPRERPIAVDLWKGIPDSDALVAALSGAKPGDQRIHR